MFQRFCFDACLMTELELGLLEHLGAMTMRMGFGAHYLVMTEI